MSTDPTLIEVQGNTFEDKLESFIESLNVELSTLSEEPEEKVKEWLDGNFDLLKDSFLKRRKLPLPTVFRRKYVKLYSIG
jgi:hypothetical protein